MLILSGCLRPVGSHIVTGTVHPAITAGEVKIYTIAPEKFEAIGMVSGRCGVLKDQQKSTDLALDRAKMEAAKMGANGLLFQLKNSTETTPVYTQYGTFNVENNIVDISGTAIFVP